MGGCGCKKKTETQQTTTQQPTQQTQAESVTVKVEEVKNS